MDTLGPDIIKYMALLMDLPELIGFCNTSKHIHNLTCGDNNFWRRKLMRDYPQVYESIKNKPEISYRSEYDNAYYRKIEVMVIISEEDGDDITSIDGLLKLPKHANFTRQMLADIILNSIYSLERRLDIVFSYDIYNDGAYVTSSDDVAHFTVPEDVSVVSIYSQADSYNYMNYSEEELSKILTEYLKQFTRVAMSQKYLR